MELILTNINKLDINRFINNHLYDHRDNIVDGTLLYDLVFEPVLFDRYPIARGLFFKIINFNIHTEFSDEEKIIKETIKNKFYNFFKINLYPDPPTKIYNQLSSDDVMKYTDDLFEKNKKERNNFFKQIKKSGYTLKQLSHKIDKKNYYYNTLIHDTIVFEDLPNYFKKHSEIDKMYLDCPC